jgi:flavin-dependent dehydrogenase
MTHDLDLDVAILGGGLAGNLVARQLRRALPDLSVAIFERDPETSWKVGESSVEIASHYFTKRLGLTRYLYENQLPKNGLRFFFDRPARDGELTELSEMGSVALPHLPSFQLDRARFEADLRRMNERAGAPTYVGRVQELALEGEGKHRFQLASKDGPARAVRARWVVDAAGRSGLIARPLKLWEPGKHLISAVWGRFEGVADIDDLGPSAFRARVKHTSRHLSTTHFCYPGYWIWFIPLGRGIVSVGLVMRREQFDDAWRKEEGFLSFLRGHRSTAQLLDGARLLDVGSYKQLAYDTRQFFGDRWATVGEAGAFSDPFYSPGSDFIAFENDFTVDLIRRDVRGAFLRFRQEATMLVYQDLYTTLGSFELYQLKWDFDIACYYNLWLEPYLRDDHLDGAWLDTQLRQRPLVVGVLQRFSKLFQAVQAHLLAEGAFARGNLGRFKGDFPLMASAEQLGSDPSAAAVMERTNEAFESVRTRALALLGKDPGEAWTLRHHLAGRAMI